MLPGLPQTYLLRAPPYVQCFVQLVGFGAAMTRSGLQLGHALDRPSSLTHGCHRSLGKGYVAFSLSFPIRGQPRSLVRYLLLRGLDIIAGR
jgi:hypothetical protein